MSTNSSSSEAAAAVETRGESYLKSASTSSCRRVSPAGQEGVKLLQVDGGVIIYLDQSGGKLFQTGYCSVQLTPAAKSRELREVEPLLRVSRNTKQRTFSFKRI